MQTQYRVGFIATNTYGAPKAALFPGQRRATSQEQRLETPPAMTHRTRFLPLCLLPLLVAPASAWNGRGHMTVAAVAWNHMTPEAKTRAGALLQRNPAYAGWVSDVPPEERDQLAFVIAATWPDEIKKWRGNCAEHVEPNSGELSTYTYCSDGEEPSHEGADANTGYTDKLEHKYWHYIDLPFSDDGTALEQPKLPNAKTEIAAFRSTLSSAEASDDVKSYDLVWLEHLVGDVHQPLHATSRFSAAFPKGDQGGNLVCIGTEFGTRTDKRTGEQKEACKGELHAFWDGLLGKQKPKKKGHTETDAENARAAIEDAAELQPADPAKLADGNVDHWVEDSFVLAKATAYAPPVGPARGPYDIAHDESYKAAASNVAKIQAELAGERLAKILNTELK